MRDKGLSRVQHAILVWLLKWYAAIEAGGNERDRTRLRVWGVRWRPSRGQEEWTPTDRAVASRSLKRLADRGLIVRVNDISGEPKRTTYVKMTPAGRAAAERLTKTET